MGVSFVNLAQAYVDDSKAILAAIEAIGTSGNFILGNNVKSFEKQFSEYVGSDFAIGVANGSDALFLIMKALGIGPGDPHGCVGGVASHHEAGRGEDAFPMGAFDRPVGAIGNSEVVGVDDEPDGSVSRNHERCCLWEG